MVLLSVPYLCTAIRELRHKRMDDSELMTVQLTECHAGASFLLPVLRPSVKSSLLSFRASACLSLRVSVKSKC